MPRRCPGLDNWTRAHVGTIIYYPEARRSPPCYLWSSSTGYNHNLCSTICASFCMIRYYCRLRCIHTDIKAQPYHLGKEDRLEHNSDWTCDDHLLSSVFWETIYCQDCLISTFPTSFVSTCFRVFWNRSHFLKSAISLKWSSLLWRIEFVQVLIKLIEDRLFNDSSLPRYIWIHWTFNISYSSPFLLASLGDTNHCEKVKRTVGPS